MTDDTLTTTQVDIIAEHPIFSGSSLGLWRVYSQEGFAKRWIELDPNQAAHFGREVEESGLRVNDRRLSRLHFRITCDKERLLYRLDDMSSTNGTFHNGMRTTSCILEPGDVIRAGNTLFVCETTGRGEKCRALIRRAAASTLRVLLAGETGTGKEVVARRIHELSGREGPFIAVNCATLPDDLAAAELFGYRRGAFSGAFASRVGLFGEAEGGTLFLDEVGDLPMRQQPMLLRALQEGTVRPLGELRERSVDVRVVAATNVAPAILADGVTFRKDLLARLAQITVTLPPLRERRADLLELANEFAGAAGRPFRVSADAAEALMLWEWPLNIRELKSVVDSFVALTDPGQILTISFLCEVHPQIASPISMRSNSSRPPPTGRRPKKAIEDRHQLMSLLATYNGNVSAVAEHLGTQRVQVYRWMDRLSIARKSRQ